MRGTNQGAKISYPSEKMLALYKCIQKYDGQTVAVSNEAENITAAEFLETVLKDPLCQIEKGKQNITPPPSMTDWTYVAYTWGKEGNAQRAEALMQTLHDTSKTGLINCEPNLLFYNTILQTWSKSSDPTAASRALRI
mmetsp:Transcript_2/g.7  ORF Transcript_2/g.7 Transcript_2/m.7 type:complete len:138 (+) Transcript_2:1081-1494(+)